MENNSFQSSAAATAAASSTDTNSNKNSNTDSNNTTAAAAAAAAAPPQNSHFQNSLRSLNKSSYKISKPPARNPNPNPNPNPSNPSNPSPNPPPSNPNPSPQSQPPVYNIDKSDFREIVQKLTGSPAHRHPPAPSPSPSPSPSSASPPPAPATTSRLHRIRPPPLSNLSHVVGPPPAEVWARPALSPLPPLPTVSAAAESPITAYMRRLRGGPSPTAAAGAPPLSPLGFGCSGMMLSPSLLMPTSPRMPLPSPR